MPYQTHYPFRIFANANLGTFYDYTFFTDEWCLSRGTGQLPILPEINLATGNLLVKSTSIKIDEKIGSWEFGFIYNAQNSIQWTINIPEIITFTENQLTCRESDGSLVIYHYIESENGFVSPSGGYAKTKFKQNISDKSWIQFDPKTGMQKKYSAEGKLIARYDARGFSMIYAYDDQGAIKKITSDAGTYHIQNNHGVITLTFCEIGQTDNILLGTWTCNTDNRITSFTLPTQNNYTTEYQYHNESLFLESITQSDGTSINFTYAEDNPGKIASFSQGVVGPQYHFDYGSDNTTITDAMGFVTTAKFNTNACIVSWEEQIGDTPDTASTLTKICAYENNDLSTITLPNSATTQFLLNNEGLVLQKISPSGQVIEYDYDDFDPEIFSLLIKRERIDCAAGTSTYATTRYVFNYTIRESDAFNIRTLAYTISPTGCVTQYDYDQNNILVSERIYLKNTYPLSGISPKTALNYDDLKNWAATQPQDAITLTNFSENNRGQRIGVQRFTEINPDGTGKNTASASHNRYTNHTAWGAAQTITEKMDSDNNGNDIVAITQQSFDALSRLTGYTNALHATRTTLYHDSDQYSVATEENGRTKTTYWNDAGQTLSTTKSIPTSTITRSKINTYDILGRVCEIKNYDGKITYQIHDSVSRLRYSITGMGRVTEYYYDDINRYSCVIHYYNTLPISEISSSITVDWVQKNLLIDPTNDIRTYRITDISDRLQFEIDGRGAIIEHRYDQQNREIITIRYAVKVTDAQLIQIKNAKLSLEPSNTDSVDVIFYNNDNHIIAKQDPAGYITTYDRNAAGFLVSIVQYATPIAIILNNTLVQPPIDLKNDFTQYYYTDSRGQTRFIVDDVENSYYIQQKTIFPFGKIRTTTQYATQAVATPTLDSIPINLTPNATSEDQITSYEYDALHRISKIHLPEMRLKEITYDKMSNIVIESMGDDPTQLPSDAIIATQTTAKQFDEWGQIIAEAPPLVYEKIARIQNNSTLSSNEIQAQIDLVWKTQSLRYYYDEATGLLLSKSDIVPDDANNDDIENPNTTYFYSDLDHRIILTITQDGYVNATTWHPVFDNPVQKYRYATAVNATMLSGGFLDQTILALLVSNPLLDVVESYLYDGCGDEINYIDPEGYETQTEFNMFGKWETQNRPVHSTTPTLHVTRQFDLRQLLLSEVYTADEKQLSVISKEYDNFHGKCTSSTDGNGATSCFTFEPSGTLRSVTDTLGNTTSFLHDAFQRKTERTEPMGEVCLYEYTQTLRQVKTTYCDASNTALSTTIDIHDAFGNVLTHQDGLSHTKTFVFNADNKNILIIDENGHSHITDYDLRGLVREKTFKRVDGLFNTQATMEYAKNRQCIKETYNITTLNLSTEYTWNALSQRYLKITANKKTHLTVFDRRSLPIEYHKQNDTNTPVVTAQAYDGQRKSNSVTTSTISLTHNYQTQELRDGFGRDYQRIIDPTNLKITDTKILDNNNRIIAKIDRNNQTTFIARDSAGNIRFTITPKGGVLEHRYNANNDLVFTAQYVIAIDLAKVSVAIKIDDLKSLVDENNFDHHTYYFYDALHNERFRLNRKGAITETRYNLNAQKIATIHYYTTISNDPSALNTETLITICAAIRNKTKDKATYRVLDALGQEIFIIEACGAVTQKFYYSTQNKVNLEIQYATKITDPEATSELSISEISAQLTPSSDDRKSFWIFDELNRLQFHINSLYAVTRYDYDGDTENKIQIIEFATPIVITTYAALLIQLQTFIPNPALDNIETLTYDFADRIVMRTNTFGKSESFTYDGASRQSSHTTFSGHKWSLTYDGASRLCFETSPTTTVYTASINPADSSTISVAQNTISVEKETIYDPYGNILFIKSGVDLPDIRIAAFTYDALNLKNKDTWQEIPVDDPTLATSLSKRPETVQSVSKTTVYNPNGSKCVEYDEAQNPTFYAYESDGFLRYKINAAGYVTEYQRNAFGECECFISYATALLASLDPYITSGLTPDIIESALVKNPSQDRHYYQVFDQNGKVIQIQRDSVVCYIPNADSTIAPTIASQNPTKTLFYNIFGDLIAEVITVDETNAILRQSMHWYDALGNQIATVDANGIAVLKTYDERGREIADYRYSNIIPYSSMPVIGDTFSSLQNTLTTLIADPAHDHHIITPRDAMGRITGTYHVGIITQQIVAGKQAFSDNAPLTLGTTYTYTDDHKIKSITYPDGQTKIHYYDERRYLVATADVVRTQNSTGIQLRPITYYHLSIHGDRIETVTPQSGCTVNLDPTSEIAPQPLSTSDQDRYHRFLHDAKGHLLVKQDPENNLHHFTHTVTGKVARAYKSTTSYATQNTLTIHLDEKRKSYDVLNRMILAVIYRDGVLQYQTAYQHDAFHLIAEGPGDGTWPVTHQFDQAARKWSTVDAKGGTIIIGYNAADEQTVEIESTTLTVDLSAVSYDKLSTLMQQQRDAVSEYEFTETIRDIGGRPTAFIEPGYLNGSIIRPTFKISLTNFNKKSSTTTPGNDLTTFEHNAFNKLSAQTDPAILVTDEQGSVTTVSAHTTFAYDKQGAKIGMSDANNHTELFFRDEASQVITHKAGDATSYYTKTRDTFGDDIAVTSASGHIWQKTLNSAGKIIKMITPSGNTWHYTFNENAFLIQTMPPANSATGSITYAQSATGDLSARYQAMGESDHYTYDRNHAILSHVTKNTDGTLSYSVTNQRDFFSKATTKTDGSGSTYEFRYYHNGVLHQELGLTVTGHGEMPVFDSTTQTFSQNTVAMPLKNLTYTYLTKRRLYTIVDANTVRPQTLTKLFDINRNPISVSEVNSAGHFLRNTVMTYNARQWAVTQTDINFSMLTEYDAIGNRRRMRATANDLTHDAWWTYDQADRVLVNDGQLINGVIQSVYHGGCWGYLLPTSQGNTFSYLNGLRKTQSLLTERSMSSPTSASAATFNYDNDDQLSSITASAFSALSMAQSTDNSDHYPEDIVFTSDGLFSQSYIPEETASIQINQNMYNANGSITQYSAAGREGTSVIVYPLFYINGYPQTSTLTYKSKKDKSVITDNLIYDFIFFDAPSIVSIQGKRKDQYGRSLVSCPRYYDVNGSLSSAVNVNNPFNSNDKNPNTLFFSYSLDGHLLSEYSVSFSDGTKINAPTVYYHDAAGHIVAEYGMVSNPSNQTQMLLQLTANPVKSFNVANLSNAPSTVVQPGDNWASVAYRMYRDSNYASILHAYSGVSLVPGQMVNAKRTMDAYNKAQDYASYQRLMDVIYSSINPALKTPQPPPPPPRHHEGFWDELLGVVVSVVVMIVVPEAIEAVLPVAFGTLGAVETGAAFAVAGALADAASQGIAIAFDDQHGFSVKNMLENAVSACATAGFGQALGISTLLNDAKYLKAFAETITLGLTIQLFQMSIGLRDKLDIKLIIEQAAANILQTTIGRALKNTPKTITQGMDELANTSLGAAFGEPMDLTHLAGSYLGDVTGDEADVFAKQVVQSHQTSSIGKAKNPSHFADKIKAAHTAAQFIPEYDSVTDLYAIYENRLSYDIHAMAESDFATAQVISQKSTAEKRRIQIQKAQAKHTEHASWESDLSQEIYRHHNTFWAKGILGISAALNSHTMHLTLHAINQFTRDAMTEVAGSDGSSYFDALQNRTTTFKEAFEFLDSDIDIQALGELGGIALGVTARAAGEILPGVSSNVASLFGTRSASRIAARKFYIETGGRVIETASAQLKADQEALEYYEKIRSTRSDEDVTLISENTGIPKFRIQRIKQHLFLNTHILSTGVDYYAPDIEIADAWSRLQLGNFNHQDIKLLQHEYYESRFERIYKTNYSVAHSAAEDSKRTWNPYDLDIEPTLSMQRRK